MQSAYRGPHDHRNGNGHRRRASTQLRPRPGDRPGRRRLRRGPLDLERRDRPPPSLDRPLHRRRRRRRSGRLRPRAWSARRCPLRWPRSRRSGAVRRRPRDRPVADERHSRRPTSQDGARRSRRVVGRARPRDPALWACDGGWNREPHGRFGADPRGRHRLVDASTGRRSTTCSPSTSSPRMASWSPPARTRTPICSGSARRRR